MSNTFKSWFLLLLISIIWGSSFLLIKLGLMDEFGNERLTPEFLGALRLSIAFIILLPICFKYLFKTPTKDLKFLLVVGILGNGAPAFLFPYAEIHLSSALSGILNSLVPVFTILIAVFVFKFIWKANHILGISMSIIGTLFILNEDFIITSNSNFLAIGCILIGSLCYSISLNVIKYKLDHLSPGHITSFSFLFIGPPCIVYLFIKDFPEYIQQNTMGYDGIIAVFILAVIGTSFAVLLFNHLIKISNPVFASSVTYFIPIVAVILGVYYKEEITFNQIIGLSLILMGVLLINIKSPLSKLKVLINFVKKTNNAA